jgi:DNA-directed RNA polymerase specialized sigma24 family protein
MVQYPERGGIMDESTSLFDNISDEAFYEQLYKAHQNHIYNMARYRLYDKNRADDVVQETFLTALQYIEDLKAHPNPIGFLILTATNVIKQHNHKQMKP